MSQPTRNPPALRWRWLLPVALLVVAFYLSPFSRALDWSFFDAASRHPWRAAPLPGNSALVLIDDATLKLLGQEPYRQRWPFPRTYFAALLAALDRAGAERIVVDLTFLENSESAEEDALLAAVAAGSPKVVLASKTERGKSPPKVLLPVFWDADFQRTCRALFSQPRTGLTDFPAEEDGVARAYEVPGSLAARAAGERVDATGGLLRWHGGLRAIENLGVPVIPAGHFFAAGLPIVDRLSQQVPDFSPEAMARALQAEPALVGPPGSELAQAVEKVRGRVVFVGANASGTFDLKPLPVGKLEPGVLLHWTAWTNLVAGGFISPVPAAGILLGALFVAGAIIWAGRRHQALIAPVATAAGLGLLLLAGSYAALSAGWFFAPATPLAAIMLTLLGVIAESYWREQGRKREIQSMFGAYVDPAVVARLVRDPDSIRLKGERREATVFFSDLVGFTDLAEKLKDHPEKMVEVVNAYLEVTSECLLNHGAYVDKYIGDAVMAVFGAPQILPDHALAACQAALAARRALETVNARYAATVGVHLEVRIGLSTGEMIMGNVGSSRKKNYTVMGDTVNLASRLEGANKEFGTQILLAESTAQLVAGRLSTRPLTRLRVKGRREALEVHELLGPPESLTSVQREFLAVYLPGYAHFTARRFAEAAADFGRALATQPDDAVTRELLRQSKSYVQAPPPADWEPILTLKSK